MIWLFVLLIFQFGSTFLLIKYTNKLLITNYPTLEKSSEDISLEKKPDKSMKNMKLILIPIIIQLCSVFFFLFSKIEPLAWLLLSNGIIFLICPVLFLRALREYIHVEYLILGSFAIDDNNGKDKLKCSNENNKP